jgi:hypothetical protein
MTQANLGGIFTFANTTMTVTRMPYGAMQLAGPQVWGPRAIPARLSGFCEKPLEPV